ncbi:hypothetical protein LTS08_003906 [Lithohypha guttulata]|nr:hypothetical protein LTS08_003906 [Lithohypha guttulata]
MFDPAQYHALTSDQAALVQQVTKYTKTYFQDPKFDASHDFNHVLRVTALAIKILEQEQQLVQSSGRKSYNVLTVVLGALLHDIDDRKYRSAQAATVPEAQALLMKLGLEESSAARVQALIDAVSYSSESKNPQRVRDLLVTIPELGIVQDADRSRDLDATLEHFDDKLLKLADMMKTQTGQELANKYTARLQQFKSWWKEEIGFANGLP